MVSVPAWVASLAAVAASVAAAPTKLETRDLGGKNVIVQMFEHNWSLGPAGYGFVQTSPATEHILGSQWWTDYQPVSYVLQSKRGTRSQFASMVATCKQAGVQIIADVVINHMTGSDRGPGTGTAGSSYSAYNYPAVPYGTNDFHSACSINYNDANSIDTCQLSSLVDLKTETDYVRTKIAAYLQDLLNIGVYGFRIDAAKHMAVGDINAILGKLSRWPFVVQEVIYGAGEPVQPNQFEVNGNVNEFRSTNSLRDAFVNGQGISNLLNWPFSGWVSSSKANTFPANHDTERSGGALSYKSANNAWTLSQIFTLASDYGQPLVLSSYEFTDSDAGAPIDSNGLVLDTTCFSNGWRCDHRWDAIKGMVGWHNAVGAAAKTRAVSASTNRISFSRGSIGHVAINNEGSAWSATIATDLPAGLYCNVVNNCASTVTVAGGSFTATIAAYDAVAFYVGGPTPGGGSSATPTRTTSSAGPTGTSGTGSVSVTFSETASTEYGQGVYLVGSLSQLGSWSPANSIKMTRADTSSSKSGTWSVTVTLPASTSFQFKFVKLNNSDKSLVAWESDPNRSATTNSSGSQTVTSSWR
ncbi:hypothetical protein OIV83_001206 [Microbotryomycetes sp. JL201]|nr:hypothetical protein OIV83_001206 [Microbotryomycetes sp. JL201]